MKSKLEIACFHLESALLAQQGGADRVELCQDINCGGITPSYDTIKQAKEKLSIDLVIMLNPSGQTYIYSNSEFEVLKQNISDLKQMGINGFVFGILDETGDINKKKNKELVELAHPLPCTFHRAFDKVNKPLDALEDIIECGFKTILTSAQKTTAIEGIELLAELVKKANNRIIIMPGGGVRSSNISSLREKLNTPFFHSSAITDNSEIANLDEVKLLKSKLS